MAARQWTDEQRQAQAERIKTYKPWLMSTGATSDEGKKIVSQNALKDGEYTAEKVAKRKKIAQDKKPFFKGGLAFCSDGDKRFRFNRSSNYVGAWGYGFSDSKKEAIQRLRQATK